MPKLIELFTDLSKKIKLKFKNLQSVYEIEYQVCGADIMLDKSLNPYLLELNSGWPGYIKSDNPIGIKNLKFNVKKEISAMVFQNLTKKKIKNKYLIKLKV